MKTRLLKKENILSFIILIFCGAQSINGQTATGDGSGAMQGFQLQFNSVDGPTATRQLELSFSEHTSDNFDEEYDTKNLELMQDDLNLLLDSEFYTSQAYSPITEEKRVDLVFQASGNYNYTIQLSNMENMGDRNIELKDNLLGISFDLRSGQAYQFSSASGYYPNRFQLTFKTTTLSNNEFNIENVDVRYVNNSNTIMVSNPNNLAIRTVEVYSFTGQRVFNNKTLINNSSIEYSATGLNTGIYIIKLVTENNGSLTKKVIVKK